MDTGRHDGASSSPNDKLSVTGYSYGAVGGSVRVDLSDGSFFILSADYLESTELPVGHELDEAELVRLAAAAEGYAASRKALDLLALREQPRARLALKLASRGFSPEATQVALDRLQESGSLDDLRFAELWVAGRRRKNPCGRAALLAGLLKQGVDRRTAERALRNWSDEDEREALRAAFERLAARRSANREKLLRSLAAKGFSTVDVRRELDDRE